MTRDIEQLDFSDLAEQVGDRLLHVRAPLRARLAGAGSPDGTAALASLRNPYAIEDDPGAFHTTGWLGAYEARHSTRAVAAESAADIAAAVNFARDQGIRLVIKGTGHDYLGRSSAPGSLLIWTHRMREITVHDIFTPAGRATASQAFRPSPSGPGPGGWRPTRRSPGAAATSRAAAAPASERPAGSPRAVASGTSRDATEPRPATCWRPRW